jgi:membrane protease subunit HflC
MISKKALIIGFVAVIFAAGYMSAYVVDETKQVVVTRFDRVVRTVPEPGLKFKIPVLENAIFYPKNLQNWDGRKGEIPTFEKTYIYVDTFARWRITDPNIFFQTVKTLTRAQERLSEIINAGVRDLIPNNRLIEAVRRSNREMTIDEVELGDAQEKQLTTYAINIGREKITKEILKQAQPQTVKLGIELVDVKIKRINYVEQVQKSVFDRMIAERKQIAQKFRSEGKGEARKVLGDKDRELKKITSEAYRTAQEIMGIADAEATIIYAEAYGIDPEFYSFINSLDIYAKTLQGSSLVLSTDTDFLKYLKGYDQP